MLLVVLTVGLSLTIVLGFTSLAGASTEDAAIFYEELSRYGTWMEDPTRWGWPPKKTGGLKAGSDRHD
jgi:hypothetical protein